MDENERQELVYRFVRAVPGTAEEKLLIFSHAVPLDQLRLIVEQQEKITDHQTADRAAAREAAGL